MTVRMCITWITMVTYYLRVTKFTLRKNISIVGSESMGIELSCVVVI